MNDKELQNIGEQAVSGKGKGSRPGKSKEMSVQTTPEENSRYVNHVLESFRLPTIDINDPQQVADRIEWYFKHCIDNGMKPTVAGVCNALKIDRQTFYRWGTGERRGNRPEYGDMVKNVKAAIWELWEQYAADGKVNPVTFIFLMKNHYGYADKQEVVVAQTDPTDSGRSIEEINERYRERVPIDVEGTELDE